MSKVDLEMLRIVNVIEHHRTYFKNMELSCYWFDSKTNTEGRAWTDGAVSVLFF